MYLNEAKILFFVSDRAKALINLAEIRNKVQSVADFFHFKHCINKLLCLALASKLRYSKQKLEVCKNNNDIKQIEIYEQDYAHNQFFTDFYAETMNNFTLILHPYYDGNKTNDSKKIKDDIENEISNIETIVSQCNIKDKKKLIEKAHNQVNDLVSVIDEWNKIIDIHIENLSLSSDIKNWFRNDCLPKTYWKSAIKKTKYKLTRDRLKEELSKCNVNSISKPENISKEIDRRRPPAPGPAISVAHNKPYGFL